MAGRARFRQLLTDWVPSVVLAVIAGHELLYNHSGPRDWLLGQGLVWLLVLRRRAPVAVLAATVVIGSVGWLSGVLLAAHLGVLVALEAVGLLRPRAEALVAVAVVEAAAVLVSVRFAPTGSINDALILLTGLTMSALLLGTTQRAQSQYLAALEERAGQLERERRDKEAIAAARERTRIAREMHDIVAHSVSVMIALSEGAAITPDPDESRRSMRQVAVTGREALAELRRVLSVLHSPGDARALAPQPTVQALPALADDVRRAGLAVDLHVDTEAEGLDEALQATVFRIVQESLTNTLKHARLAGHSVVEVAVRNDEVRVSVTDDGSATSVGADPGAAAGTGARDEDQPGNGIRGMRERAEAFDGSVRSGPGPRGWVVEASLRRAVHTGTS